MKGWLKFSGVLGLVLFLFGMLGALLLRDFSQPLMLSHIILGAGLIAAWTVLGGAGSLGQAGQAIRGRTARFGANALLYTAVFLGFLGLANWFGSQHDKRWDLTAQQVFSLSAQSIQAIQDLKQPLKLVSVKGGGPYANADQLKDLFDLYKYNNPSKVSSEVFDAASKPHLVEKYGFKPGNLVYIAYGEEDKAQVSRINESSEEAITNAIIKLTRGASKKLYYVQGHGEPGIEDDSQAGLKGLADAIGDENLAFEPIVLSQKGSVPEDAAAVLLVSPKKPLLKQEKDMLLDYADKGGRLLLMTDPRTTEDVKDLAQHFGIVVSDNVVLDQMQRLFAGPAIGAQPIVTTYGTHPITRNLKRDDITIFNLASSVAPASQKMQGATYTDLAKTSASAWAETDLAAIFDSSEPTATLDPSKDIPGPVTLAESFENPIKSDEKKEQADNGAKFDKATRVVVVGDSDWILNASFGYYSNRDLALNMINWLVGEEGGITIRPRSIGVSFAPIPESTFMWLLATSFIVPELILILGLAIWWRRRSVGA